MNYDFSITDIPPHGTTISPSHFYTLASTLFNLKERQKNSPDSPVARQKILVSGYTSFPNDETAQIIESLEAYLTKCSIDYKTTSTNRTCFSGSSKCIIFRQKNLSTNAITISFYERSKILKKCGITKFFQTSFQIYSALQGHHMGEFVNIYNQAIRIEIIYIG